LLNIQQTTSLLISHLIDNETASANDRQAARVDQSVRALIARSPDRGLGPSRSRKGSACLLRTPGSADAPGNFHHPPIAVLACVLVEHRGADYQFVGAGAIEQVGKLLADGLLVTNQRTGQRREYAVLLVWLPQRFDIVYRRGQRARSAVSD